MDFAFTIKPDPLGWNIWQVALSPDETDTAEALGMKRHRTSELRGERPAYGCSPEAAPAIHRMGTCCEFAAAKALGLPMPTHLDTHGQPDLPPDIQIRGTSMAKGRVLRAFERDKGEQRYVLVQRLTRAVYQLRGWCPAHFAKQKKYWGQAFDRPDSGDCWRVPEAILWSMATFDWPGRIHIPSKFPTGLTADDIQW